MITLSYPDGSEITLQQGGMMQDPHPNADQIVTRSESRDRVSRRGADTRSGTFWRLDSYKQKLPKNTSITWLELFPPTVGYDYVPKGRKAEFDNALNTFELRKRAVRTTSDLSYDSYMAFASTPEQTIRLQRR